MYVNQSCEMLLHYNISIKILRPAKEDVHNLNWPLISMVLDCAKVSNSKNIHMKGFLKSA